MNIIVDANVLFSVLIKGEFTLNLLFLLKQSGFEIISCEVLFEEIEKRKGKILKYSQFSESEFEFILNLLREMVTIIPLNKFKKYLTKAGKICSDKFDIPYVALSLSFKKVPIWSNDKVLKKDCQKFSIKVLSTSEIKELILK